MAVYPAASLKHAPAPGTRVEVRGEQWLVKNTTPGSIGDWGIRCVGISGIVKDYEAIFLSSLDEIKEVRPEATELVHDSSPGYSRSKLFIEALQRRTPPTDELIHIGHAGAFDQEEYQLRPAELALKALRPSILIADGVGIGKTIEAGILLVELIKRGRGERVLVLAIRSVLEQFQREFWTRFSIPLVRLDSDHISRIKTKIPASKNPFHVFNRCIISMDTLKNDGRYRTYLEQCRWDVVIVDECHKLTNDATQRGKLADLLAARTDSMILTSATPHNGKPESFARLMNMLDPTAIADETDYGKEDIEGLFVRRFKKDLSADEHFRDRNTETQWIDASDAETRVLKHISKLRFNTLDKRRKGRDVFFRYTLMKAFLSSPEACAETIEVRLHRLQDQMERDPSSKPRLSNDESLLELLLGEVAALKGRPSGKTAALVQHLKKIGVGPKSATRAIVFAERRTTLEVLQQIVKSELGISDAQARVFHAGLPDQVQMDVVDEFGREDAPIRVLIAGDVASEGVNLHFFCNHLIHFDIPWSVILLEQRNGRIDRYGQEKTPHIHYLLTRTADPTIDSDLRIYRRLLEREEYIYRNIGDPAMLAGVDSPEEEEEEVLFIVSGNEDLPVEAALGERQPDFLELLNIGSETKALSEPAPARSLPEDDMRFLRQALELSPETREQVEYIESDFVSFQPPDDLRSILTRVLPHEALPAGGDGEYRLTTNRDAIQKAIKEARKIGRGKEATRAWPQVQFLWELHPAMQWAIDKTLVAFERNEAPVVVAPGLSAKAAYLFQATIANARGQVGLTAWFTVEITAGGLRVRSWEEAVQEIAFQKIANTGAKADLKPVSAGLGAAVRAADGHCAALRKERLALNEPRIAKATERIEAWRKRSLHNLDERERKYRSATAYTRPRQEELEGARKKVAARFDEHRRFVNETLGLVERPSLRIAAVFVGAGV